MSNRCPPGGRRGPEIGQSQSARGEELEQGIEGCIGVPRSARGPWVFCARGWVWVCVSTQCVPRMPADPARQGQKDAGACWCPHRELQGPRALAHCGRAPGTAPRGCAAGGGGSAFSSGKHMPVDGACPLYYLAYPQRKSLQIPSFLPAAVRPPPGSGSKAWNLTLPPPHLPPLGVGLGGWPRGGHSFVGGCRWLTPFFFF